MRDYGTDVWERASPECNVRELALPALVIHDQHDSDVPWQQGEAVASAWPGARFMQTQGLGHQRILRDHEVVQTSVKFLAEAAPSTSTIN